jgi:sugar/nucleoside kinase (ribokinase family)
MEEKGCMVGTGETIFHKPSYKVTAADTNGTGDVFFGAFTYGLIRNWSLEKTAAFSCAAAARSCAIFGKEDKLPHSEAEVNEFIKTHTTTG